MYSYLKYQYQLYCAGCKCIGIEKIRKLAGFYLTESERAALFGGGVDE